MSQNCITTRQISSTIKAHKTCILTIRDNTTYKQLMNLRKSYNPPKVALPLSIKYVDGNALSRSSLEHYKNAYPQAAFYEVVATLISLKE